MTARTIPDPVRWRQIEASDPAVSAFVSANAGAGKTHVLAQRVIRLLLSGTAPEKILCLTYTKAAAANMANRVFDTLRAWTVLDDFALDEAMRKTGNALMAWWPRALSTIVIGKTCKIFKNGPSLSQHGHFKLLKVH